MTREEKVLIARKTAASGMVLLKNDGRALPLRPGSKIALWGITSYHCHRMGAGSGDMPAQPVREYNEGLAAAGLDLTGPLDDFYQGVLRDKADFYSHINKNGWNNWSFRFPEPDTAPAPAAFRDRTAVVTLGRNAGEAVDLSNTPGSFLLDPEEERLLEKVCAGFGAVVVLLNVCGVVDVSFLDRFPNIKAVLLTGLAGETGGDAVADVLTGKVCPSGRLAMTWGKHYEDYPTTRNFAAEEVPYNEGVYVGYRYFDTFDVEPRFPFGFGLSYTTFRETADHVSVRGPTVSLRVTVENTGDVAGAQVVQCYLSSPSGKLDKPFQALCGFGKTQVLEPGGKETLDLSFDLRTMASYDESAASEILEKGDYLLRVGVSSRDTRLACVLRLSETVVVRRLHTLFRTALNLRSGFGAAGPARLVARDKAELVSAPVFPLDPDALVAASPAEKPALPPPPRRAWTPLSDEQYGPGGLLERRARTLQDIQAGTCSPADVVGQFTSEELARCVIGFNPGQTAPAGNSGAGEMKGITDGEAGELWRSEVYGIPPSNCADGPSGVRLAGFAREETVPALAPLPVAYPSGTLVAQTWDAAAAEDFGRCASDDLAAVGVDGWLAPGVNIQRNPLCGRNFEYLSEDPLLSGQLGGRVVRGVQLRKRADGREVPTGRYATMKHFAANNQEKDRDHENNIVSERALREIYLKSFWWCNEVGRPLAVMTAYNKINGEFCATNPALLTTLLRDEWGFDGLVMTDWWNRADRLRHCAAGNDLQMDGWKFAHDGLVTTLTDALSTGAMDRRTAEISAARVLDLILRTKFCESRRFPSMPPPFRRTLDCRLVGVHTGKTVCAENAGKDALAANRDALGGAWELFSLRKNGDGSFSLKSAANGKYVSADPGRGGLLLAEGPVVDLREKFDLRKIPGKPGTFTLWSRAAGKYVSVDESQGNRLVADRDVAGDGEEFRIFVR